MLIAIAPFRRLRRLHQKMIMECPKDVDRLLEVDVDLETQAIETNDVDGLQREVCRYEDETSSVRVNHNDETHQLPDRSPQQVMHGVAQYDPLFALHGAHCLLVRQALFAQRPQLDLASIHPRAPTPTRFCCVLNPGCPSHGVRAHANQKMIVLREQALDHLSTHVIAISHKVVRLTRCQAAQAERSSCPLACAYLGSSPQRPHESVTARQLRLFDSIEQVCRLADTMMWIRNRASGSPVRPYLGCSIWPSSRTFCSCRSVCSAWIDGGRKALIYS